MLLYSVVFLVVVALVSGGTIPSKIQSNKHLRPNGRIIGGTQVAIEDNPWQVSLRVFGLHTCGGSIVDESTIITAAHCVEGLTGLFEEVVSGTNNLEDGGTVSEIKDTIIYPGYDGLRNDLAFISLIEPLVFNNQTAAIPLADTEPAAGDTVRVTGWGVLHEDDLFTSPELYGVELTVVERAECQSDYAGVEDALVDDKMICAGVPEGGKGFCSGDSGGPLTKDGILVGIASWGQGCGEVDYPGVYTNIAALRSLFTDNAGV